MNELFRSRDTVPWQSASLACTRPFVPCTTLQIHMDLHGLCVHACM